MFVRELSFKLWISVSCIDIQLALYSLSTINGSHTISQLCLQMHLHIHNGAKASTGIALTTDALESIQWRYNECDGVSNHQPPDCLLNRLFKVQIKENIKATRHWPFVRRIHRWPVNSPHKGPVTRKMFPFDDVIMIPSQHIVWLLVLKKVKQVFL